MFSRLFYILYIIFTYEGREKRKLRVLVLIFSEGNRMDFLIGIDFFQSFGCFNQNFIRRL